MAKKKLSRDQKRKRKKQRRARKPSSQQRLVQRIRRHGFEQKIVRNPPGEVKMSDVLRQFVEPYWHIPDDEKARHRLISTALVAWNAALLPDTERAEHVAAIAKALPEEIHADFYAIVDEMIKRKEKHFASMTGRLLIMSWLIMEMAITLR